jgi:hypothetical protein
MNKLGLEFATLTEFQPLVHLRIMFGTGCGVKPQGGGLESRKHQKWTRNLGDDPIVAARLAVKVG